MHTKGVMSVSLRFNKKNSSLLSLLKFLRERERELHRSRTNELTFKTRFPELSRFKIDEIVCM